MHATTTLPALATSPGIARRWALDVLTVELSPVRNAASVLTSAQERTEIVVSELVTNAIVHARSDMTLGLVVALATDRVAVRIEVTDGDSRLPRFEHVDDQALGGRGLQLVAALCDGFGHDLVDFGKTVWAEFQLPLDTTTRSAVVRPSLAEAPAPRVPVSS